MNVNALKRRETELKAELAKTTKARAAIGEKAIAENRGLADDERAAFVAMAGDVAKIEAQIADNAELLAAAVAAEDAERNSTEYEAVDESKVPRVEVPDRTKQVGWFGRQLQAVHQAALGGLTNGDRDVLREMQAAATGMNTDVPSEGGFAVGTDRAAGILERSYATGAILSRVNRMPISAGSNSMKVTAVDETSRADSSRFGGIVSGWLGQGNALSSGKPKLREMDLKLKKVGAFVYATDEMIADAVLMEAFINRNLPLELNFRVEDAVVNGVGGAQPFGLLASGSVVTVNRAGASTVQSVDLQNMFARMWAPIRSDAVILVNQSVEPQLDQLGIAIGTAGIADPNYKAAGSLNGQTFATYKGVPIIPVEYCAALGTKGDIILTNLSTYTMIDKGGVQSSVSMHVAYLTDEQVFRFIYRVDGQSEWSAPLTPKSGGDKLSNIVVLS